MKSGQILARLILLFVACVVYSVVRYVVFAPQNLNHLPVFVVNKGVSTAAALCFAVAFCQQWWRRHGRATDPTPWFRAGVFAAIVHMLMSLAILKPSYFPEFFAEGQRLSFIGEAVFMFGGLTAGGLYLATRTHWTPGQRWAWSLATMAVLVNHVLFMGLARGLKINASHAYLPPMWLLSLIGIVLGALFLALSRSGRGWNSD